MNWHKMWNFAFGVLTYLTLFVTIYAEDANVYRIVDTQSGLIRGSRTKTLLKKLDYFSFKGIPYGTSPIGELRFKPPKPIAPWKPATLDTLEHGKMCYQYSAFIAAAPKEAQSEDCLFLNVFAPANIDNEKLAVMVWFHGGAYSEGSGDGIFYGPDFIVEQNVILVTVNYRLGAFGFMSLDTPEYSGNMGLKDQQLALKWVHANIDGFGGDNNRITIFGESAGGASTHFHMLSPESRKFYSNAISMSGTTENFWAFNKRDNHLGQMFELAKENGAPKQTYEELVEFLKSVSPDKIIEFFPQFEFDHRLKFRWTPVTERSDATEPFITEELEEIYKRTKTDMNSMFGSTSRECLLLIDNIFGKQGINFKDFTITKNLLPFKDIDSLDNSKEYRDIANEIEEFYLKNKSEDEAFEAYIDLLSDINFAHHTVKVAKVQAKISNGQTFYYRFSVESKFNILKHLRNITISGSSHGDELCYLFRCAAIQPVYDMILSNKDSEESKISLKAIDNLTKLFTNFAKHGTPTHNNEPIDGIKPIEGNHVHFVDITNDGLIAGLDPNHKANEFWRRLEEKATLLSQTQSIERDEL